MQLFNLSNKTALITGASSGIGEQFAHTLAQAGARVILAARRIEKLEELAAQLQNAVAIKMDVADKISVSNAFKQIENERIDICINCAGIAGATAIFGTNDDQHFENIMQTNVMGVWYVTKAVANHMKEHGVAGSIINIASTGGANYSRAGLSGYCASKASVIQMTKCLVGELAEAKIRINAILPGTIITPMTAYRVGTEEGKREHAKKIPLGFVAEPNDLDGTLLYLACNKASRYVTGTCITVDGGVTWGG
jgi:NAD(P)-dependent dehydrogenase (short-subunit alcohol dehydrogenase family)